MSFGTCSDANENRQLESNVELKNACKKCFPRAVILNSDDGVRFRCDGDGRDCLWHDELEHTVDHCSRGPPWINVHWKTQNSEKFVRTRFAIDQPLNHRLRPALAFTRDCQSARLHADLKVFGSETRDFGAQEERVFGFHQFQMSGVQYTAFSAEPVLQVVAHLSTAAFEDFECTLGNRLTERIHPFQELVGQY